MPKVGVGRYWILFVKSLKSCLQDTLMVPYEPIQ